MFFHICAILSQETAEYSAILHYCRSRLLHEWREIQKEIIAGAMITGAIRFPGAAQH